MTEMAKHTNEQRIGGNVLAIYNETLVPQALRGLEKMFLTEESAFCEVARSDSRQKLILSGISLRYTAMSLIGLTMQDNLGHTTDLPLGKIADRLVAWCEGDISSGDGGLVLWALALRDHARADQVARCLVRRMNEGLKSRFPYDSMALGWLLSGLAMAMQKRIGGDELNDLAARIYRQLMKNRCPKTGLFSLATPVFRKNCFAGRVNGKLGSFASQVYPIIGLSYYSICQKHSGALRIAEQCSDMLCRLQGPEGQWWWLYHAKTARCVIKYPVYSVHQNAMGPMALLAVLQAGGNIENGISAVEKSLTWLDRHPELPGKQLISKENPVIWRAIQRDDPSRTAGFGLGFRERVRMNLAAWVGRVDNRSLTDGYVCYECRPYHLGWILFAAALGAVTEDKSLRETN